MVLLVFYNTFEHNSSNQNQKHLPSKNTIFGFVKELEGEHTAQTLEKWST